MAHASFSPGLWQPALHRIVLLLVLYLALVHPSNSSVIQRRAAPPQKLPKRATENDLRYQPALDFDTDSCYNVPAIGCDGKIAEGLEPDGTKKDCRDLADLDNTNVYSRQRCNSGWCAYMYDYYFEKDHAGIGAHKHDWEHIIVWVPDDRTNNKKYACVSQHGEWLCNPEDKVLWKDEHPKDWFQTRAFRFANAEDDKYQENERHDWQLGDLVGWFGFPTTELRSALETHHFGSASFALGGSFTTNLKNSLTAWCDDKFPPDGGDLAVCKMQHFPHPFDPARDDNGSPGQPPGGNGCNPTTPGTPGTPGPAVGVINAMIVGDSITQGFEGDYTWRFRLAEWFKSENITPNFVGPWTGTHTNAEPSDPKPPRLIGSGPVPPDAPRTGGAYANGVSFKSNHWALWGRQAAQVKNEIRGQVSTHSPDWLLVMLGFNDLGWWVSGPDGTLASVKAIVDEARAAKSNVRILIANVIHRTFIEGRDDLVTNTNIYNDLLKNAIPGWSTSSSPVKLVDVNSVYSCAPRGDCSAAYDGLHPGPKGEYQIAHAFSKTLVEMGAGKLALSVPGSFPASKVPTVPNNVRVSQAPWGLKITWDKVWGANAYEVRSRQKGISQWSYWPSGIAWPVNRWDNSWVLEGQEWEYSVRTNTGTGRTSEWSGTATGVARPTNPKGPNNVWVEPRGNSIFLRWDAVPGAISYEVITFDNDATGTTFPNGRGVQGTSATVSDGLIAGHRNAIAIVTWVSSGPGWPTIGMSVRVGAGQPGTIQGLRVSNTDPTTVLLSWPHTTNFASYRVWFRNHKTNEAFRTDEYSIATDNSHTVAFLFPGTWNYEFYVVAMNGNIEGGRSNTVIPPVYPGFQG
ncbi:NLP effector protein 10 like [Verticillium longisporum]|nr:NLP effector protein 10 like [Verticillium longisporum]